MVFAQVHEDRALIPFGDPKIARALFYDMSKRMGEFFEA